MNRALHHFLGLCLGTIIFALSGYAQMQIPNANFEDWIDRENEDDSLVHWSSTSNLLFQPFVVISKNEASYQGNYAIDLQTNPIGFTGASTVGILVNGDATFSFQNQMHYVQGGGTPISFQPTYLKGFYKLSTTNASGDQAFVRVVLSKYNTNLNQRDTVSHATMNLPETDNYTEFQIPLPDLMPALEPDSITTIFYSSDPATVDLFGVQSKLTLDSLHLTSQPVGLFEERQNSFAVFPNPTSGMVSIIANSHVEAVEVFNGRGEKVRTLQAVSGSKSDHYDLSDLPAGMYFLLSAESNGAVAKLVVR